VFDWHVRFGFPQSASLAHATQVFVDVSQTDVDPVHCLVFAAVQVTHVFVATSQAGVEPKHWASVTQVTQLPLPSHTEPPPDSQAVPLLTAITPQTLSMHVGA